MNVLKLDVLLDIIEMLYLLFMPLCTWIIGWHMRAEHDHYEQRQTRTHTRRNKSRNDLWY